jgi:hypothetical protein
VIPYNLLIKVNRIRLLFSFFASVKQTIMRMKKIVALFIACIAISLTSISQVTTSSMNGTVKTLKGVDLAGATITAIHTPTGTTYSTSSRKGGIYYIANMNPGGPYTISVSFVGYKAISREGLYLSLGETLNENF